MAFDKGRTSNQTMASIRIAGTIFLLVVSAVHLAVSQNASATQAITLRVMELNKIDLIGGPLNLQIASINDNAAQPNPAYDASTKLCWTSNGDTRKIAVASNLASPRFMLKIEAERSGTGSGTAKPEITLSDNAPHDLILGVERSSGACTLRFTAMANGEQGIGTETRTITYTITGS